MQSACCAGERLRASYALPAEIAGLRHSMEGVAREKERLLSRLEAKEREVGGLATKASLQRGWGVPSVPSGQQGMCAV